MDMDSFLFFGRTKPREVYEEKKMHQDDKREEKRGEKRGKERKRVRNKRE